MNHPPEKQEEAVHSKGTTHGTSLMQSLSVLIDEIRPYMKTISSVQFDKNKWFETALTSSLVRNFQFLDIVTSGQRVHSFYLVPALRGITEDIIYLQFLSRLDSSERNEFLEIKAMQGLSEKVKFQHKFFSTFRPFQPVIGPIKESKSQEINEKMRSFLKMHFGVEGLTTRSIAEKCGQELLAIIYDFIYRLTSATVHFDLNWQMKLGWGDLETGTFEFDTSHFEPYFSAINCVYGAYLFCIFFELFEPFFNADPAAKDTVEKIRKLLIRHFRWPELVTFEEMNIRVPEPPRIPTMLLFALYMSFQSENGFIAASREILSSLGSGESTPDRPERIVPNE